MKRSKREPSPKQPLGARLRTRLRIQDEPRFYFILQLLFAAAQILIAHVAFLLDNVQNAGLILIAVFGVAMMLLAGKGWQNRAVRLLGRSVSGVMLLLLVVIFVADALTTTIINPDPTATTFISRSFGDYFGQILSYLCQNVQPLLLMLFPAFAIAARRTQQKTDIRILQIGVWSLPLLAAVTLGLSYEEPSRMTFYTNLFGISNRALLIIYLICTIASVLSVFMSYPYGVRFIKNRIEKARGSKDESKSA